MRLNCKQEKCSHKDPSFKTPNHQTIMTKKKNSKRRRIANDQDGSRDSTDQLDDDQELTLEEAEARDLHDLQAIAAEATVVEFDPVTGRPLRHAFLPSETLEPIDGLIKLSHIPTELQSNLSQLHHIIKRKVLQRDMVPWAGVGEDTTRCGWWFPPTFSRPPRKRWPGRQSYPAPPV